MVVNLPEWYGSEGETLMDKNFTALLKSLRKELEVNSWFYWPKTRPEATFTLSVDEKDSLVLTARFLNGHEAVATYPITGWNYPLKITPTVTAFLLNQIFKSMDVVYDGIVARLITEYPHYNEHDQTYGRYPLCPDCGGLGHHTSRGDLIPVLTFTMPCNTCQGRKRIRDDKQD